MPLFLQGHKAAGPEMCKNIDYFTTLQGKRKEENAVIISIK